MGNDRIAVVFWLALGAWLTARLVAAGPNVWLVGLLALVLYQAVVAVERWLRKVRT